MGKVFKITELVLTIGNVYTVGAPPAHFQNGNDIVEKIMFNRADNAFNKGLQVPGASYTVSLAGDERRLIPINNVFEVGGMWTTGVAKSPAEKKSIPELPDA